MADRRTLPAGISSGDGTAAMLAVSDEIFLGMKKIRLNQTYTRSSEVAWALLSLSSSLKNLFPLSPITLDGTPPTFANLNSLMKSLTSNLSHFATAFL
ncbi:hypothetical protein Ahy_A10g047094 isoform B [Arachis hypogaea]|uniref:Uncharacterized protein n=1 Tax=Arachis hypogaea TaxID=3818 RepID=A0A445B1M6_ARAHY|nr:hypothetical protein Ahy_A10g047094 isoform B [Arachis hypogaea]